MVNVVLDLLLIYGMLGFPRMEVAGAALASSIAILVKTGLLLWLMLRWWRNPNRFMTGAGNSEVVMPAWTRGWKDWFDGPLMLRLVR